MVNKLLDAASFLKTKFKGDELDEKLAQAVSEENWQASTQLLHEIANASYNYQKQQRILNFILEKLKNKNWKKILKALHLVDFLLKYGPTSLTLSFRENIYEFRSLDGFSQYSEGIDRGESIRKQAKQVIDLLSDDQHLNDERANAKKIKERMANVIGTGAYYGSYSNEGGLGTHLGEGKKQGYENYSSDSFKVSGGSQSSGLSFGESVMNSLHKKSSDRSAEGPSKLNLNRMIESKESKYEQPKKSFNSLSLKLVKPPEKKTANKKQQLPTAKPTIKPKADILDLDVPSKIDAPTTNSNTSNKLSDPFDFLGGVKVESSAPTNTLDSFGVSKNNSKNQDILSFDLNFPNSQPPAQNIPLNQSVLNQGALLNNKIRTAPVAPVLNFNAPPNLPNNGISLNAGISLPKGISLNLNPEPKLQKPSASSLIDLSNFREQLSISSNSGSNINNNITNWNW